MPRLLEAVNVYLGEVGLYCSLIKSQCLKKYHMEQKIVWIFRGGAVIGANTVQCKVLCEYGSPGALQPEYSISGNLAI
jgi:hypothetical protein